MEVRETTRNGTLIERVKVDYDKGVVMLTDRNRTQQSIQSVEVDGLRNVPLRSQVTLNLTSRGISSTTLALYDIKYYPLDSGDKTEISVGDPKMDVQKALAQLRQKLDTLVTS